MCTVYSKQCQILSRSRSLSHTLTLQGLSPQDVDTPSLSPVFLAVPSSASDSAAQLAQVAHPNSRTHSPVFVSDLDPESHRALGLLFRAPPPCRTRECAGKLLKGSHRRCVTLTLYAGVEPLSVQRVASGKLSRAASQQGNAVPRRSHRMYAGKASQATLTSGRI